MPANISIKFPSSLYVFIPSLATSHQENLCSYVFLSLKSHPAKYVFMFLCLLQLTLQSMSFCLSVFKISPCKICLYVLMSSTTHFAPHVFQSPFLAFCLTKKSVKLLIINSLTLYYVVLRGLEPRLREPKTLVLPLHHRTNMSNHTVTIASAKVVDFSSTTKLFALFIARKRRLCLFFCAFT